MQTFPLCDLYYICWFANSRWQHVDSKLMWSVEILVIMHYACEVQTFYSSFPDSVGVLQAWHDVVGDDEGETEAVGAAILESKCIALLVRLEWDRKDQIRSARWQDCQVQHLNLWFRGFCLKNVRLLRNAPWLDSYEHEDIQGDK